MSEHHLLPNKVAQSGLIEFNPEIFLAIGAISAFDIQVLLYKTSLPSGEELFMLREKHFREQLQQFDFTPFSNTTVAVLCSADTLIPSWAWMLVAIKLREVGADCMVASIDEVKKQLIIKAIENHPWSNYQDAKVVIKGCSQHEIGPDIFAAIAAKLQPYVKSMMYGEPCSTVPLHKRK